MIYRAGQLLTHWSPRPRPSLDLDFLSGPFDPRIQFARASSAWDFDATGTLVEFPANTPRRAYDPVTLEPLGLHVEEQRTNSVRNPRAEGAVAGTPGTSPQFWNATANNGLTTQIVGNFVVNGVPVLRVRFFGTTTSGATCSITYEQNGGLTNIPLGASYTQSAFLALVAGSWAGTSGVKFWGPVKDSTGAVVQDNQPQVGSNPTAALTRYSDSRAVPTTGSAPFSKPTASVIVYPTGTGVAVDFTLDIGLPQLELGAFATSPIMPPAGSPAASTRAAEFATLPLGDWWGGYPFTTVCEVSVPVIAALQGFAVLDDGSTNNRIALRTLGPAGIDAAYVAAGTVTETAKLSNPAGAIFRAAMACEAAKLSACVTGGNAVTAAGPAPSGLTTLRLGQNGAFQALLNGYARDLRIYPLAMTPAQLQRATAL